MQSSRSFRGRRASQVGALLVGLLAAGAAQGAPQVDVTYDLGDSSGTSIVTIPLIGDVPIDLGPENFEGRQTIRYSSDSAGNIVSGPVSLVSFHLTVNAPVATPALTLATSTLYLSIPLTAPEPGGTLIGGVISAGGLTAPFYVSGLNHCYALCAAVGLTVSVVAPLQPTTFTQTIPNLNTSYSGATHIVTGTTTASFTLDPGDPGGEVVPVVAQTQLVGREIAREMVPEPASGLLLGAGLAGVLALWRGAVVARRMSRRVP